MSATTSAVTATVKTPESAQDATKAEAKVIAPKITPAAYKAFWVGYKAIDANLTSAAKEQNYVLLPLSNSAYQLALTMNPRLKTAEVQIVVNNRLGGKAEFKSLLAQSFKFTTMVSEPVSFDELPGSARSLVRSFKADVTIADGVQAVELADWFHKVSCEYRAAFQATMPKPIKAEAPAKEAKSEVKAAKVEKVAKAS